MKIKDRVNTWDNMHNRNRKYMNMVINKKIIKNDQKAVKNIQKKIFKEMLLKQQAELKRKAKRMDIRNNFLRLHKANFEWERKLGLVKRP